MCTFRRRKYIPEHFKNYSSSTETTDRDFKVSKNTQITESLEYFFKNKHMHIKRKATNLFDNILNSKGSYPT